VITESRLKRDQHDIISILLFLEERNPSADVIGLKNIATGVIADQKVNVDEAYAVGANIIQSMQGQAIQDYTFKRCNQAITLNIKNSLKVDDGTINVDSQLLFQRLTAVGNLLSENTGDMFRYELSSYPSAPFEPSGLPRQANKPALADSIWSVGNCASDKLPTGNPMFVLDGDSLIQRLPWVKGATFEAICESYVDYISKRYDNAVVVSDGYPDGPSTKDITHLRRSKGMIGPEVCFSDMPCKSTKEIFLSLVL